MEDALRESKERFVSQLAGTTVSELCVVTFVVPTSYFAVTSVIELVSRSYKLSTILQYALEFSLIVMPCLLAVNYPLSIARLLGFLLLMGFASVALAAWQGRRIMTMSSVSEQRRALDGPSKPFITAMRSYNMILTIIAILAVDFHLFPRRFAKTETYGVSLMDAGVGWIQLFGALTSKKAKVELFKTCASLRNSLSSLLRSDKSKSAVIRGTLMSALPLFALGMVRLVVTTAVNYQHHVSEYGVHWNFFFTLCATSIFFALSRVPLNSAPYIAGIILIGYEVALARFGLRKEILSDTRPSSLHSVMDFVWMNKEGIFSLFGFFALGLLGASIGAYLLKQRTFQQWQHLILVLCVADGALWFATMNVSAYIDQPSRRLTNLAYVLWVISHFVFLLIPILLTNVLIATSHQSLILSAINRNQLAVFLLANLGTGAINLSTNTLAASDATALITLTLYCVVVTGVAVVLHKRDITLKFW